jgi:hypothetical protein
MSPELNCSFSYIAKISINIQNSLTPFIPKKLVQFRIDRRIYTMNFAASVIFYDTNMLEVMFERPFQSLVRSLLQAIPAWSQTTYVLSFF